MIHTRVWIVSLILVSQACGIKLTYPFGGVDYRDRADDILDKLRSNLNLNVFQDTISNTLNNPDGPRKMYIKNSEGNLFAAGKQNVPAKSSVNETGMELYDPVALANALDGTCAVLSIDYWNYEWCHRKQVSQFHMEQQGPTFTKSPDWSLGKFERSVFIRENQRNTSTPLLKVVDYFKGGQHCDETNDDRSVEIHIQCCEKTHLKNYISADVYYAEKQSANPTTNGPPMPKATLNAIDEPSVCAYKAIVCTPLLCKKPDRVGKESTSLVGSEGKVFTELLKALNSTCLLRSEVWWTYELCFGKGVRQLRLNTEQSVMPDGNVVQKQVMASQFILGNPQLDVMTNETALVERTNPHFFQSDNSIRQPQREEISTKELEIIGSSGLVSPLFKARGKEPKFLTLEYDNGTLCDLHDMNRSTIVEIYCGLSNNIVSILEDSTCHYRMKVEVTALCALADFQPKKDNVSTIAVNPVFPRGAEYDMNDLVAAAAASTVNYQVPETHTRVMQDGTVIETQTAVIPKQGAAVVATELKDDSPAERSAANTVSASEASSESQQASSTVSDTVVEVEVTHSGDYGLTPQEFASSRANRPPTELPSDLPYDDNWEASAATSNTAEAAAAPVDADADAAPTDVPPVLVEEVSVAAESGDPASIVAESSVHSHTVEVTIDPTPVPATQPVTAETAQGHQDKPMHPDNNQVVETYKSLLMGLSLLTEVNVLETPITRDQFAGVLARESADTLQAHFARTREAVSTRWLRRMMDIIDYDSLINVIQSIPHRPRGSDTFFTDRMTCYGPRISSSFVLFGDEVAAASKEEEEADADSFDQWIDCLKHEENLLIAIEAMFTVEEEREKALERHRVMKSA